MKYPRVLSLCDRTGNMVRPWLDAGCDCVLVDEQHAGVSIDGGLTRIGADVRTWEPAGDFDVAFAFPPCTHLAGSGARWWAEKGEPALQEALAVVDACARILSRAPVWMLENPVGRLSRYWREPDYTFNPCDFGGYLTPPGDAYTKRTCLWTSPAFRMPPPMRVDAVEGSRMHVLPPGPERADLRSETPMGFARAVWLENWRRPLPLFAGGMR